jgi:hypothetical protein
LCTGPDYGCWGGPAVSPQRAAAPSPAWVFRVQGLGFRLQDVGYRIQDSGFRVKGLGFRV